MATELKIIDAKIKSIANRGKILKNDAHAVLLLVLEHYQDNGDYTRLPMLIDAVKEGIGSSISAAMIDYVHRFVPTLTYDKEAGDEKLGFFIHQKGATKAEKALRVITRADNVRVKGSDTPYEGPAEKLPFFNLERIVKQEPFDFTKAIMQLVVRAEKALEKNTKEGAHNNVNAEQVKVVKSLAEQLKNIKPDTADANGEQSTDEQTETPESEIVADAA